MDKTKRNYRLYEIQRKLNIAYEEYAKSIGLTYNSMQLLYFVNLYGGCTQKQLSEDMFLSKQTVHSMVLSFQRDGIMVLSEQADDKRNKTVLLTAKGKAFADKYLPAIEQAEEEAIAQFSSEQEKQFLDFQEQYYRVIAVKLKR